MTMVMMTMMTSTRCFYADPVANAFVVDVAAVAAVSMVIAAGVAAAAPAASRDDAASFEARGFRTVRLAYDLFFVHQIRIN